MNCFRTALVLSALIIVPIAGTKARANDVIDMQGQKIILLNQATVDEISAEIAKPIPLSEKESAVKTLLLKDATAADGFCETSVRTYATATRPTAAKLQEACLKAFNDPEFINAIAVGELAKATDPTQLKLSFREKLSFAISGYMLMTSMGPF